MTIDPLTLGIIVFLASWIIISGTVNHSRWEDARRHINRLKERLDALEAQQS